MTVKYMQEISVSVAGERRWSGACRLTVGAFVIAVVLWATGPAAQAVQPCTQNCAVVALGSATGYPGGLVAVPVSFTQALDDGQPGQGNDEVAALAFTIGLSAIGAETPLTLSTCNDNNSDGLPDAVTVDPAIVGGFRVVIENWLCTNRSRCLCPGAGQTLDNFINVVVYGPLNLPSQGPVTIPPLPKGPQSLFSVALRLAPTVPANATLPLHLFAETDTPQTKPAFGAFLSIGDKAAIDQTCVGKCVDTPTPDTSKVRTTDGVINVVQALCVGDCNGNRAVTVDELVTGVKIALGGAAFSKCPSLDAGQDGEITVDELIVAVNNALHGCK